jgi:hypothetical protein|tara:strand:+ start:138 stop:395 length:258 start_codon:yes stop_codon:yes gene_type:complete
MAEDNSEFTRRNIIEPSGAAFDQIMGELEFVAEEHGALPTAAAATYATLSWVVSVAPSKLEGLDLIHSVLSDVVSVTAKADNEDD